MLTVGMPALTRATLLALTGQRAAHLRFARRRAIHAAVMIPGTNQTITSAVPAFVAMLRRESLLCHDDLLDNSIGS